VRCRHEIRKQVDIALSVLFVIMGSDPIVPPYFYSGWQMD
jgi:hypothetical protein